MPQKSNNALSPLTWIIISGFDTAWDNQYKEIMKIPPYKPEAITVPYMYLSSEHPKKN